MSSSAVESRWPVGRWWFVIGVVFCAQIAMVFWLGETSFPKRRSPANSPLLRFAGPSTSLSVALSDPTLFALPHRQVFAGDAWMQPPLQPLPSMDWAEKPFWLSLPSGQLGQLFSILAGTNLADSKQNLKSDTALTMPKVPLQAESPPTSRVRVAGQLAQRRLLTDFEMRAWPHGDILTNTIINLVVTADGQVLSADLVSGSGLFAADQDALKQANAARFNSIASSGPGRAKNPLNELTWGSLVFEWRTLPLPMTNAPPR